MQEPVLEQKTCTQCGQRKPGTLAFFYARRPGQLRTECIICVRTRRLRYCRPRRKAIATKQRAYYALNAERERMGAAQRRGRYSKEQKKRWFLARRRRVRKSPTLRIIESLRARTYNAIIKHSYKDRTTQELLGADFNTVIKHLEARFQPGMNWDNYGGRRGWQIDHVKPCIAFDLSDRSEQLKCFHYTNLQPLWAADNAAKISDDLKQRKILNG